mgnify:CR=1 FL=1
MIIEAPVIETKETSTASSGESQIQPHPQPQVQIQTKPTGNISIIHLVN